MEFFKSVASLAQNAIESINNPNHLTPDQLMQGIFHMPSDESIIDEINIDYIATSRVLYSFSDSIKNAGSYLPVPHNINSRVSGKLTLTQNYILIKQTDGAFDKIVFHLMAINKVQKIPNAEVLHVRISTLNGMILDILCDTIRSKAEHFWHIFRKQYEINKNNSDKLNSFQFSLYSEYLISKNCKNSKLGEKHIDIPQHPNGGLGLKFKFPGNESKEKEILKLKRWFEYFRRYGRNLELVQNHIFNSLILVGVPNRLRGEIWETACGSIYSRFENPMEYTQLLDKNIGKHTLAIEEIEKDLNRSLPEYPAFQTEEGIDKLRRVLTAYSWKNPEIGYCQAMNIVTAALLIFMTEDQAFWTLNVLCDKIIPGYYSKTMYGVLLDQKVFEGMVKKTLPLLGDHFTKYDIQLSIVSLPWFLSFFLNTMPLVFAFRVMDSFFYNGPRTLFQVALAIVKMNAHELLECTDDGECIDVFKNFFLSLDELRPENHKVKRKFDVLWEIAFNDFQMIDDRMIVKYRNSFKNEVFKGIDLFVKRAEIRNLPDTPHLKNEQISNIYDRYYRILLQDSSSPNRGNLSMNFEFFEKFMDEIVPWVNLDRKTKDQTSFLKRLYTNWSNEDEEMSLESLVVGIDKIVNNDLMNALSNFFSLYDPEETGRISKETVLEVAEDLIFITTPWREGMIFDTIANRELEDQIAEKIVQRRRNLIEKGAEVQSDEDIALPDEVKFDEDKWKTKQSVRYLSASSSFLQLAFKYAQPYENPNQNLIDLEDENTVADEKRKDSITHNKALDPTHPVYITPSMFRMVILANETYSSFFENQFWKSFDLDSPGNTSESVFGGMVGNIRGMVNNVMADGVRVASQVKKKMGDAKMRADTAASSESGASISTVSENKPNGANRSSIDSKGAESVMTGWTLESGALGDNFEDHDIENFMENSEEKGLLNRGGSSDEEEDEDDDFGNFVPADKQDNVKQAENGISHLLLD